MYAAGVMTVAADAGTVKKGIVVGLNASGQVILEKFTLNGTTPIVGTAVFSLIQGLVLADVEVARTVTIRSRNAADCSAGQRFQ